MTLFDNIHVYITDVDNSVETVNNLDFTRNLPVDFLLFSVTGANISPLLR